MYLINSSQTFQLLRYSSDLEPLNIPITIHSWSLNLHLRNNNPCSSIATSYREHHWKVNMAPKGKGENTKKAAGNAKKAEVAAQKKAVENQKAEAAESQKWQQGSKDNSKA
jgi:hypothetical protein